MSTRITKAQAVRAVHDLAAEFPDQTNGRCIYKDRAGAPVCLVGHVFARLAPEYLAGIPEDVSGDALAFLEDPPLTFEALAYLGDLQAHGDSPRRTGGRPTWAELVKVWG